MKNLLMKKCLIVIAAAAMLAGCAKNEVTTPVVNTPAEITFTTAPLTKALAAGQSSFSTSNIFSTCAYYTPADFDYTASGEVFFDWQTVSHNKTNDNWKTATSYFWPKDGGKLSFFSWSLNTASLKYADGTTDPAVTFDPKSGITLSNYASGNDFMVADPALNKIGNFLTYQYLGVPTLFRHKAAQINFKVKTKKAYTGRTFTLNSISFVNVSTTGTYVQGNNLTGTGAVAESWTAKASDATTVYFDTGGLTFADTEVAVTANGTSIFVPQSFTDADDTKVLEIKYSITTGSSTVQKTAKVKMNTILGGSATQGTAFQMGKIYTITLIFSGSEILWNPEVVDWLDSNTDVAVSDQ